MVCRIFFLACLLLAGSLPAHATRFYVNQTTGDDRRSHITVQDADTPWRTLTHALQMAHIITQNRPHVIDIASGSYSPSTGETLPFVISQANIFLHSQGGVLLNAQGLSRILEITVPTSEFVLRNFSLLDGFADRGGAVSCDSCTLRVVDSRIQGNKAADGGDAISVTNGRLELVNNILRNNGSSSSSGAVIEARNTFADTSKRDVIRNNTFYQNKTTSILTTGNRTDISNNILVGIPGSGEPAIIDSASGIEPLVRYNLFWDTDILYLSGARDSVKVARTVRDTLTLAEQGVAVPSFVTNVPDTVAKVGSPYQFDIGFATAESNYKLTVINPGDIPTGMSESDIESSGILNWTPEATQIGQHALRIEIIRSTPPVQAEFLSYVITVFTEQDFPDTTTPGDVITITTTPDTSAAADSLNLILPVFSVAASAGGNAYADPLFLDTEISRFELISQRIRSIIPAGDTVAVADTLLSLAIDKGNPVVAYYDAVTSGGQVRNDMGRFGGPINTGVPNPGTTTEREATALPDSVAVEGQPWTYDPALDPSANILIIDLIQGPTTMGDVFGSGEDKSIPVVWTPALADTGSYLVGVESFFPGGSARHYFPLRVRAANARPRILGQAPTTTAEDVEFAYAIDAVDDDGDTISYNVTTGPQNMTVDVDGIVRWTPLQADVGDVAVVIGLTDSQGSVNTHAFTLTVTNTNDAPVMDAISDTVATEDLLFVHALSASDEDAADSSFTFSLSTAPDSVAIDSLDRLRWTPVQADVGAHTITILVADTGGATDSTSFVLTVVEVDDAPTISSSADTTAPEDAAYEYAVVAVDEEGGALNFSLVTAPTGMLIDTTGVISWTPALADTGSHAVSVRVADPSDQAATQDYQLEVTAVNDPPVILTRSPVDTLVLIDPGQSVQFELSSSDEEGDLLTLQWLVDGTLRSTESSFSHLADTTSADTVVANLSDGNSTTSQTWIVDARAIAKVSVATDTVDFGNVSLDSISTVVLRVSNPGRTTLTITDLQVGNLAFSADFGTDAIALRDSTTLTLSFTASSRGARSSIVQFSTNDPDLPSITIPLVARAVVPTMAALDINPEAGDQEVHTGIGRIGDSVAVDLEVAQALQLVSYTVELNFDPTVLNFSNFAADAAATNLLGSGLTPTVSEPESGVVHVEVVGTDSISGAGTLGRWSFEVAADAEAGTSSAISVARVELLSSGEAAADTLSSVSGVVVQIANAAPGDVSGDGVVSIDDFFLFADDFGTSAPRSDFNSDGSVDFTDFFLFADFFNAAAAARPVATTGTSLPGLAVAADVRPQNADRLDVNLFWSSQEPLRGAAIWLSWDPQHLAVDDVSGADSETIRSLVWSQPAQSGRLQLAVAPTGGAAFDGDVAVVHFRRLTPEATQLRVLAALGRTGTGNLFALDPPPAISIAALPNQATLYPAFPNPFNPETVIPFFIPSGTDSQVEVRIFDLLGRRVRRLTSGLAEGGHQKVVWRGRDDEGRQAGAGVYLVELRAGERRQVRKVMLLK